VKTNSYPYYQIRHHCPKAPYLFIGCKFDLRHGPTTLPNGQVVDLGPDPVTPEQGEALAKELWAHKYLECSALTQEGLKRVFDEAIRAVLDPSARNPPPLLPPKPDPPAVTAKELTDARFTEFVNRKEFSDVTFKVQDKELAAHKIILSAASPMFQKIFVNGATELPPMFTLIKASASEHSEHKKDKTLALQEREEMDWKREEHVTIEVKDYSVEAFLVVLHSCYTMALPTPKEFSKEAVEEGLQFFQKYPRYTANERRKFLINLAEKGDAPLADMCVILPSKKRVLCHKALLVAGSEYFGALLADSQQNCMINLDMTDLQFDAVKLFMYSNVAQFDNRPYSYSQEFLPMLVKMNMYEYASHCACHLRDSVSEEDKKDQYGYVLSVLNLADELELRQLRDYCIWWMQVNYDTIHENNWFKTGLSLGDREEVVRGQWPGPEHNKLMKRWKKKGKKKDKDCVVQ
jgi:hypothetical protein